MTESEMELRTKEKNAEKSNGNKKRLLKEHWWTIDKDMIYFKLHFFLLSGALGAVLPFIGVFAKTRLMLSATSFATIMTFQQFLFVLTKPVIGYVTDYFNKLKVMICILAVAQIIFLSCLLLVPPLPKDRVLDDSSEDIIPSLYIDDMCILCEKGNYSRRASIDFEPEVVSFMYLNKNGSCNNLTEVASENSNKYIKVIILSQCESSSFNSSTKVDKIHSIHLESVTEQSTSNSNKNCLKTTSCKVPSNILRVLSLNDFILCCNVTKSHHFLSRKLNETILNRDNTDNSRILKSDFQTYQFWIFALFFTILNACINGIFTLSDTACYESVEKIGGDFGKQRLWGCVGWGLFSPLGGFLSDYTGSYLATWIVFVILSCLALWNIVKLDLAKPHISNNILKDIGTVMNSKRFILFAIGALLSGMGLGFTWFYLLWFITSIGGSSLLCGLVQTVQSFTGDIPFMFFSGWMLNKLGDFNIVTLSLLACCIRFLWYSQLQNAWLVLPIEWTHGITYGVFYATMASFAKMNAKPGTEATTQSVIFAIFDGLGSGIGNIVAGIGFDYLGGKDMFFYTGIFFGCSSAISVAFTFIARNKKNYYLRD
ncbi:major facilitator superfamily domain-containing protein 6 [Nephila pilipes]|uniref:Major facilitator superfamily domain-containing protein 6 n=1 Tax=Nephila pilipes TaxID=299642 RepID=A0A8X6Q5H7_NEPPI|nr:major facilitator superfamily domain-containing protein 6 [Nephila pilipes]